MALFGFGKDKRDGASAETVYAYLEDAQRTRTVLTVKDPNGKEATGLVQTLDEGAGSLTLQMNGPLVGAEKGMKVELIFMADALRVGGSTRLVESRPGNLVLELPEELGLRERRKAPRVRLLAKEGATVTALTGLFEGVGITGNLENISETGARVKVDKAMNIKDQKKLPLGASLMSPGQELGILKLNKVPKCPPVIEITGRVVYVESDRAGLFLGIAFAASGLTRPIGGLASSRGGSSNGSLPPKSRRRAPEPSSEPTSRPAPPRPAPETPPRVVEAPAPASAPTPAPPPAPTAPAATTPLPAPDPEAAAPRPSSPLLRLKKRARAILIWGDQPLAGFLADHLLEEGYGKVLALETLEEVAAQLPLPNLGLILIDRGGPLLETLEGLGRLAAQLGELPPVVLAAEELSAPLVIAATRQGVTQLLVKPYALDEALSALIEAQMGLA